VIEIAVSCIEDACLSAVTITSSIPPVFSSSENTKKEVKVKEIKKMIFFMKPSPKFLQKTLPKSN
jgi:hypothetical protein